MAASQSDAQRFVLRYGELAIALYAAPGLPFPERRQLDPQELATYVAQGLDRLGGEGRARTLNSLLMAANRTVRDSRAYEAAVEDVLRQATGSPPDTARFERCVAYDFGRLRAAP